MNLKLRGRNTSSTATSCRSWSRSGVRSFSRSSFLAWKKTLKDLIDKEGYDVVLNAQAAIYKSPKADITKLLLERLNAEK